MKRHMPVLSVKDPVCGMVLNKRAAVVCLGHNGKTYYFCASVCHDEFLASPEKYLDKRRRWRRLSHTNTHQHRQQDVVRFSKRR